jgi:hypothetical protein
VGSLKQADIKLLTTIQYTSKPFQLIPRLSTKRMEFSPITQIAKRMLFRGSQK